jgi:hypothetical protein
VPGFVGPGPAPPGVNTFATHPVRSSDFRRCVPLVAATLRRHLRTPPIAQATKNRERSKLNVECGAPAPLLQSHPNAGPNHEARPKFSVIPTESSRRFSPCSLLRTVEGPPANHPPHELAPQPHFIAYLQRHLDKRVISWDDPTRRKLRSVAPASCRRSCFKSFKITSLHIDAK